MKTINDELKELTAILNGDSINKEEEYQQKFLYIQEHYTTEADSEAIADYLLNGYHELSAEADELNRMIALQERIKEMKEIVPISYIARNYFGKSTAWLQQRIYGYKVRGRVYTLSEQDRLIFNNAIHDICNKLGSLSIA
ncbi:DUF5053 domain-containing protein [Bacteroides sp. AM10-21B]|uniref:DUF5053 domain-containing protein n=1 Tax=Bacteroides sp. AM10-21B TaxID=2292001 RepID=UPI000E549619|nr:DUF5053 domain-containing protein [Bacteroides sp. AM10-21B]RHJ48187.1 DUF5053 domain-containing protein [Bacteroides sp. AM10-21B]